MENEKPTEKEENELGFYQKLYCVGIYYIVSGRK